MAIERKAIFKQTAVFTILFLWFLLAAAPRSAGQQVSRWEVFAGYSYLRMDTPTLGFTDYSNLNGFNASVAWNFTRTWSVVLDGNGHYGSHLTVYNYMAGPQYSWRREKSRFLFQALFGKAQNTVNIKTSTRSGFESVGRAFAAGAGYELDLTPRFTFRVVQADYLNTSTFGATQNDARVSTGVVVHFGQIGKRRKR